MTVSFTFCLMCSVFMNIFLSFTRMKKIGLKLSVYLHDMWTRKLHTCICSVQFWYRFVKEWLVFAIEFKLKKIIVLNGMPISSAKGSLPPPHFPGFSWFLKNLCVYIAVWSHVLKSVTALTSEGILHPATEKVVNNFNLFFFLDLTWIPLAF